MYKISENADYYLGMAKAMKVIINSYLGLGEQQKALGQLINFWTLRKEKMMTTILYRH